LASSSGENGMPRHSWGLATRTRRARPSEKTTLRPISGLLRKATSPLARHAAEGRALHARRGTPWLYPGMPPLGHRACVHPSMIMPYPGLAHGFATRARRPRPSETTTPALSPAFHRKATRLGLPTPWRGGLRTPAREALPLPGDRPVRPPASRASVHDHDMPWFASDPYFRTRRARPCKGGKIGEVRS